jgi:hypothetical protein
MPGYFSITKRDFGSTGPDVWGFRSHLTHKRRAKRGQKKNGAQKNSERENKKKATIQQGKKKKNEQIVLLLTARCHS